MVTISPSISHPSLYIPLLSPAHHLHSTSLITFLFPHQWLLSSPLTLQKLQVKYTNLNMSKLGSRNDCKTMTFELLVQSYVPQYAIFKFYCKFHSFDFFFSAEQILFCIHTNFLLPVHFFPWLLWMEQW